MTPLIDGDILLHELGWSGQFKDKETEEEVLLPFEHVQKLLDKKIENICYDVEATNPPGHDTKQKITTSSTTNCTPLLVNRSFIL